MGLLGKIMNLNPYDCLRGFGEMIVDHEKNSSIQLRDKRRGSAVTSTLYEETV
ncbi:hypothetical protein HPP92_017754 [Vanilla planifolia]|uniref:Uncharacterized protein n=1 Tax=Vanilla planifolia TaxID=51239 RepID=A0A835Q8J3_VANPL|nr:hypothetical protein HPP92_017754 [Vanilla planifolia]